MVAQSYVAQPRINDLLCGRVSRFSLDAVVNIATALGCRRRIDLEAAQNSTRKTYPCSSVFIRG